ncbi:MAG: co-chaperone DjlA [Gammaproteobacteria bacterium]|nr:co-chaperone DjlA [Gammaproteobacteria bacterium]
MSWWGKVFGGAAGYILGGPLGGLVGVALGHNIEKGVDVVRRHIAPGFGQGEQARIQAAFFTAAFSVMGHLARSDGSITPREISMAKKVMAQMKLNEEQKKAAGRLFNEGKRIDFPFYTVLSQFRNECQRRRSFMRTFLEIQLHTAFADGALNFQEKKLLMGMADCFGFSKKEFEQLSVLIRSQHGIEEIETNIPERKPRQHKDAYAVLGVTSNESYAEIKKAYRRLISLHHPDKLAAKGLPEDMIKLATEKLQEIKSAYDQIKTARGY